MDRLGDFSGHHVSARSRPEMESAAVKVSLRMFRRSSARDASLGEEARQFCLQRQHELGGVDSWKCVYHKPVDSQFNRRRNVEAGGQMALYLLNRRR